MKKKLSFIDKQRLIGKEVVKFAIAQTRSTMQARMACMEAARQLHGKERAEKRKKLRKEKQNETIKSTRKDI